jgi:hypothetical protein
MVLARTGHKPEGRAQPNGDRMADRVGNGLANWPLLARQARLPADGWTPALLTSRKDAKGDRTVIRLSHPTYPPVICKQSFRPADAESMARSLDAQDRAARALADHPAAGVPRILARLDERCAALIQAVAGPTLLDLLGAGPGAPQAFRRAGAWLDAFHRSEPFETRAFQPRFMLDHFTRVAESIAAGKRRVPRPARFTRHVEALCAQAPRADRATTVSARRHGDLTARNIILSPERAWGFDMSGGDARPVGYDIARLLVYATELMPVAPSPDVVPPDVADAFFQGYGLTARDDAAVQFLVRARLLSDWVSMPETRSAMTVRQLIRFERISRLAAAALP